MKIYIVEDDETLRIETMILLKGADYEVVCCDSFINVVEQIREEKPHLILLDINLPNQNGYVICSQIREFSDVPIIFITSRTTDDDELKSILVGGDEFITKPYNISILLAKIQSIMKRVYNTKNKAVLCYGNIRLIIGQSCIEYESKIVELTKNEFSILYFFFTRPEGIIERKELIDYLWNNHIYIVDNALSVNITRIRNKLESIGISNLIQTKHGQGYIMMTNR